MLMLEVESDSDSDEDCSNVDRIETKAEIIRAEDSSDSGDAPLSWLVSSKNVNRIKGSKPARRSTKSLVRKVKRRKITTGTIDQNGSEDKTTFTCSLCGKTFKNYKKLSKHIEKHSKFNCNGCDREFSSQRAYERHRETFAENHLYQCPHCSQRFHREKDVSKHCGIKHPRAESSTSNTLICNSCFAPFPTIEVLAHHYNEVHSIEKGNKYVCYVCDKIFISEEGFNYHNKRNCCGDQEINERFREKPDLTEEKKPSSPESCKICSAKFESKKSLQTHLMQTHHATKNMKLKPGIHQCCICPRSFVSSDGLKYHLATHTGERQFGCEKCGRRFIKRTHLSEHVATHSHVKYFKCERCPRKFTTYSAYRKHLKLFPGPHSFPCEKCSKVFSKESMLEKHLCVDLSSITLDPEVTAQLTEDMLEQYLCIAEEADREADEKGLKSCYRCFKVFPNMAALQQHQGEHVGKQVYQCRFCPVAMFRADDFSAHISNHLGSTPYMCLQCNRKFISPFTLANHAKNFPGEHSFTCKRCERWFPSPERLEKHDCIMENNDFFPCACGKNFSNWNQLMEHIGSKPYKCCVCDQKYLTMMPLTRHIKAHTGARPYVCAICGKSFLTKANCANHEKVHELVDGQNYRCQHCDYATPSRKRLDSHLLKKHNESKATSNTLCPVCGVFLSGLAQMRKHLEELHENTVTLDLPQDVEKKSRPQELCTHCGKLLNTKYSLALHIKKVHDPNTSKNARSFKCLICTEEFKTERQLEKHKECHEPPGPRVCSICLFEVPSAKELKKHLRRHDTVKPFSCTQCGKHFKVAVSLKYHKTICDKRLEEGTSGPQVEYREIIPVPQMQAPLYF